MGSVNTSPIISAEIIFRPSRQYERKITPRKITPPFALRPNGSALGVRLNMRLTAQSISVQKAVPKPGAYVESL